MLPAVAQAGFALGEEGVRSLNIIGDVKVEVGNSFRAAENEVANILALWVARGLALAVLESIRNEV